MAHIMAVCQVRTFTTLVENGQSVVAVTSVIIALTLNTVILAQVLPTYTINTTTSHMYSQKNNFNTAAYYFDKITQMSHLGRLKD